jgi:hypothetical protein
VRAGSARAALLWLVLAGCAAPAPQSPPDDPRAEAQMAAGRVSRALHGRTFTPGCGSAAVVSAPGTAVLVNTRQALSCRGLGYALRRMQPLDHAGTATLVVPASDTSMVCPFLRQERVRTPVAVVDDPGQRLAGVRTMVAARMGSGMTLERTFSAATGLDLLSSIRLDARH